MKSMSPSEKSNFSHFAFLAQKLRLPYNLKNLSPQKAIIENSSFICGQPAKHQKKFDDSSFFNFNFNWEKNLYVKLFVLPKGNSSILRVLFNL